MSEYRGTTGKHIFIVVFLLIQLLLPIRGFVFDKLETAIEPHREELEIEAMVTEYGVSRRRSWQARANMRLYLTDGDEVKRGTREVKEAIRPLLPVVPGVTFRPKTSIHIFSNSLSMSFRGAI